MEEGCCDFWFLIKFLVKIVPRVSCSDAGRAQSVQVSVTFVGLASGATAVVYVRSACPTLLIGSMYPAPSPPSSALNGDFICEQYKCKCRLRGEDSAICLPAGPFPFAIIFSYVSHVCTQLSAVP